MLGSEPPTGAAAQISRVDAGTSKVDRGRARRRRTCVHRDRHSPATRTSPTTELDRVVIRFAGDSGDGMQLAGTSSPRVSSLFGNDIATLPDFPAEIRAPAGTLAGVSGFQIHISDHDIFTPGDAPNVLVAMNPAALKANLRDLAPGGILIVNTDAFDERDLDKAGYSSQPARRRLACDALHASTRCR